MLAQLAAGQQRPPPGVERVVVALGGPAGVAAHRVFAGCPVGAGGLVVGIAHAGGGQLGLHRFEGGAAFGGEVAADARHAVLALGTQGDAAPAGPVLVGEVAVGVDAVHHLFGQVDQLIGAMPAGFSGQVGVGVLPGRQVHPGGHLGEERADDPHMFLADAPVALGFRGRTQGRGQRLPGQRAARAQIGGVVDPAAGQGGGDP